MTANAMDQPSFQTDAAFSAAVERGQRMKAAMLEAEGGVLSPEDAAARLGVSISDLSDQPLFELERDGEVAYPAFQFGDDGLLPGLARVMRAFRIDDRWMRVNIMLTGDARLGGRRPIDMLREGRTDEVVRAVGAYGEQGAA